jgi:hypothetical protein
MTNVNPNTHLPHGDDPSVSDATGPVVISEGEQSALAETSMEKENKTPNTAMTESEIHNIPPIYVFHSDVASPAVNQAGEDAFQPQAKTNAPAKVGRNELCFCGSGKKYKKCCGRGQAPHSVVDGGKSVAEFLVYQSHKYGEAAIYLLGNLKQVLDIYDGYHGHSSGTIYKAWFDFATRKVLDVKKVKRAYLKTGVTPRSDEPLTHTPPDHPEYTLEFGEFDDPNPIAAAQALFDLPESRKLLEECEKELSKASPVSKGRMITYKTLEPVIDIMVTNPDLPGPDGVEPVAGKLYRVKFNLVTWKVLSFKEMPQDQEATAEELRRDPPSQDIAIMNVDEDVPEEATRDLAGMQRFFDDPARDAFFCGLGELLMKIYPTRVVNVA